MTSPPTTLYLARHGQSEWNHLGRVTGQTDIALSARGIEQSAGLARCLQAVPLAAIYTSGLARTVATAMPVAAAQGLDIRQRPALDEIHMGVLQGRFRDERDPPAQALWAAWQADPWGPAVPGGECFAAFAERVLAGWRAILDAHPGEAVLLVGHRATNRVLLGSVLGWPRERWQELRLRNKFCYRVQLGPAPQIATFTLSGSRAGQSQEGFEM